MSFPTTRYTLIHRIATNSDEEDWALFLADYWRPLCRFASRWGRLSRDDAEDVASSTLDVIVRNDLLARWNTDRRARLRTLLCGVVRRVAANVNRAAARRTVRIREYVEEITSRLPLDGILSESIPRDDEDAFYAAWAEELLQSAVESLLDDYHREGRGDYFRVFYGRVCDAMPVAKIATALQLKVTDVDNFYRHARRRLEARMRELVRWHVVRYADSHEVSQEFDSEWQRLGAFLAQNGGLESALRQACTGFSREHLREHEVESLTAIIDNVREFRAEQNRIESPHAASGSDSSSTTA